jgi:hypothetical protein
VTHDEHDDRRDDHGGSGGDAPSPQPALHPDEVADWIDEVEAALERTPLDAPVDDVLEQQRAVHEPDDAPAAADDGIAPLVNNTGQDGGAASG